MALFSARLAADIATHHGIVTIDQLVADGTTLSTVKRHLRDGMLVRLHHGVLRVATSPDTFESRCVAACAADDELVITGVAAARLWAFRHVWVADTPIALVAHDRTPIRKGVLLRRTNRLDDIDVVSRADGIRVASPPRTWFDCARDVDDERFERLRQGGRFDAQRDKGRDRGARRIRWQVDRVTDQELTDDVDGAIDDVVELYALCCREVLGPAA